jgi:hypothetical protein
MGQPLVGAVGRELALKDFDRPLAGRQRRLTADYYGSPASCSERIKSRAASVGEQLSRPVAPMVTAQVHSRVGDDHGATRPLLKLVGVQV